MSVVLRPAPNWTLRVAVGMVAALAVLAVILVLPSFLLSLEADYETATAEKRVLELVDGSVAVMAPESAIAIEYSETTRIVRLLEGEAFFYVTPNPDRPFRVTAGDATASTVGATFNVRMRSDHARISVRHGLVDVANGAGQPMDAPLEAGHWMKDAGDDDFVRGSGRYQDVGRWTQDELSVGDRRLGDLVDDMRRYIPGVILLLDSELSNERVTNSTFNLDNPNRALRNIASRRGAEVRQLLPGVLLVSRD